MELRRFKDILAVKEAADLPAVAFHAKNLEIAEISESAWFEMRNVLPEEGRFIQEPLLGKHLEALQSLEDWEQEQNPNVKSGELKFGISQVSLNVTQICNLKCVYCAAGGDGTYGDPINRVNVEKTLPQLKYFIENLPPGRKFKVNLVGGEPLLYPEAVLLIGTYVQQLCAERGLQSQIAIVTNGTLITPEVIDTLVKIRASVSVSLDGPGSINDRVRPMKTGKPVTETVVRGLEQLLLVKNSLASLGVVSVFGAHNNEVVKAYEFLSPFDLDWMDFVFANEEKDERIHERYLQQMQEIAALAWKKGGEAEISRIRNYRFIFDVLDDQQRIENYCGAGKSYLAIDAKNQLYPCVWTAGNKSELVGSGSVINTEKLTELQKPLIELNNCQTCWARYICGGGCMAIHEVHTGSKHKKDQMFCKRTRFLISLALVYYHKARSGRTQ